MLERHLKSISLFLVLLVFVGCGSIGAPGGRGIYVGRALGSVKDLHKAATLSDEEVIKKANQSVKHFDNHYGIASPNSKYTKRLNSISQNIKPVEGLNFDFKVVMIDKVNACAFPNGSIRFFKGMMDSFTDDEIRAIIGHEIGHVVHSHRKEKMRMALLTSAARKGVASQAGTVAGAVAASQIGGLTEAFINAQFSQSEESEADEYSVKFMRENNFNQSAALTVMDKFAELGGESRLLSTHPGPLERKEKIAKLIKESGGEVKETQYAKNKSNVKKKEQKNSNPEVEPKLAERNYQPPKNTQVAYNNHSQHKHKHNHGSYQNDANGIRTISLVSSSNTESSRINRGWYIQVAADNNYENASSRLSQLKRAGFSAHIQNAFIDRGNYYRLLVGPYNRKNEAKLSSYELQAHPLAQGLPFIRYVP